MYTSAFFDLGDPVLRFSARPALASRSLTTLGPLLAIPLALAVATLTAGLHSSAAWPLVAASALIAYFGSAAGELSVARAFYPSAGSSKLTVLRRARPTISLVTSGLA